MLYRSLIPDRTSAFSKASARGVLGKLTPGLGVSSIGMVKDNLSRRSRGRSLGPIT